MGIPDEEKEVTPEKNDPVSFHVEGVVTKVTGDVCEVDVRFVNGERPAVSKQEKPKAEKTEEENLREAAMTADEEEGEY